MFFYQGNIVGNIALFSLLINSFFAAFIIILPFFLINPWENGINSVFFLNIFQIYSFKASFCFLYVGEL